MRAFLLRCRNVGTLLRRGTVDVVQRSGTAVYAKLAPDDVPPRECRFSYSGVWDEVLGVDQFWTEKWFLFVQYLQELGLLWSYPALQLPQFWYIRTGIFRLCVMDVYAGYTRIQSYSGSRRVAGEIVLLACLALLFLAWGLVRRIPNVPYRTRHAERVLYALVVLSYPAFVTNMLKYWICRSDGVVDTFECSPGWGSLAFAVFSVPLAVVVPVVAALRIRRGIVYQDTLHHENYLRSREVEYLLRINMTYRNSRLWMASSYRRRTAYFDVVFMLRMLALALLMCGFSFYRPQDLEKQLLTPAMPSATYNQISAACVLVLFVLPKLYFTLFVPFRCPTTNWCYGVFGWLNVVNVIWGLVKAGNIPNPDEVTLYPLMMGYNLLVLLALAAAAVHWYTAAHHRDGAAAAKRRRQFEALLVPAAPHPAGEAGRRRAELLRRVAEREAELSRRMRPGEVEGEEDDGGPIPVEEFRDAEKAWREEQETLLKALEAQLDEGVVADDAPDVPQLRAANTAHRLARYDVLLVDLEEAKAGAEDPQQDDYRRLQSAMAAAMAADQLTALLAQPLDTPLPAADGAATQCDADADAAADFQAAVSSGSAVPAQPSTAVWWGRAVDVPDEDFAKAMPPLHYDGTWMDDGGDVVDHTNRPFYRPYCEVLPSNDHVRVFWRGMSWGVPRWPVHSPVLQEIIRDNVNTEYLDCIRNARRYLEYCSQMRWTPELLARDAALPHLRRVNACLQQCKRRRVTHHCHAIHPLQLALEELLEALTYEFNVARQYSALEGPRAARTAWAAAFLHRRLLHRDEVWVLLSPTAKRILLKLLVLRTFIELVVEQRSYLRCAAARQRARLEGPKPRPAVAELGDHHVGYYLSAPLLDAELLSDVHSSRRASVGQTIRALEDELALPSDTDPEPITPMPGLAADPAARREALFGPEVPIVEDHWSDSFLSRGSAPTSDLDVDRIPSDEEAEELFIDLEERIRRRAEQLKKEEDWQRQKELEREEVRRQRKEERRRQKQREAEERAQAEEAARQREAEEERRLEEEKLRRLQAIAGEHQRWLQAKAEREAQELAAAEAERRREEELQREEDARLEEEERLRVAEAQRRAAEADRRRAEEAAELQRQRTFYRRRQQELEEVRLKEEEEARRRQAEQAASQAAGSSSEGSPVLLPGHDVLLDSATGMPLDFDAPPGEPADALPAVEDLEAPDASPATLRDVRPARLRQQLGLAAPPRVGFESPSSSSVHDLRRAREVNAFPVPPITAPPAPPDPPTAGGPSSPAAPSAPDPLGQKAGDAPALPPDTEDVAGDSDPSAPAAGTERGARRAERTAARQLKREAKKEEAAEFREKCQAMSPGELQVTKRRLNAALTAWKQQFVAEHQREPLKRDIEPLPIAATYAEYKAALAEVRRRKAGPGGGPAEDEDGDVP